MLELPDISNYAPGAETSLLLPKWVGVGRYYFHKSGEISGS